MIQLSNIEVINIATPYKAGLFINSYYHPMGAYELWTGAFDSLTRHGWFAVSERASHDATMTFIRTWLNREGIAYCE